MGTIVEVGNSLKAIVRKAGFKTRTKTISKDIRGARRLLKDWVIEQEAEMVRGEITSSGVDIGRLTTRYIKALREIDALADNTLKNFEHLARITDGLELDDLTANGILTWKKKACPKAGAVSVTRYLTRISTVLSWGESFGDVNVPWREFRKAKAQLRKLKAIATGKQRTRRLEPGELDRIKQSVKSSMPMNDIVDFALLSALRSAEITRIRWKDLNHEKRTILVRDRKHPTEKTGNDQEIPLLGNAMEIIERQPRGKDEIFPYNCRSVEKAFYRAVSDAGVEDFCFHDLRHEGISRLFEMGYSIPEVALVSGHKSWNSLKIYTNLKPESLHNGPNGGQ